jgi:hypothetical protein
MRQKIQSGSEWCGDFGEVQGAAGVALVNFGKKVTLTPRPAGLSRCGKKARISW